MHESGKMWFASVLFFFFVGLFILRERVRAHACQQGRGGRLVAGRGSSEGRL